LSLNAPGWDTVGQTIAFCRLSQRPRERRQTTKGDGLSHSALRGSFRSGPAFTDQLGQQIHGFINWQSVCVIDGRSAARVLLIERRALVRDELNYLADLRLGGVG